jgi:hypothetical protein
MLDISGHGRLYQCLDAGVVPVYDPIGVALFDRQKLLAFVSLTIGILMQVYRDRLS